MRLRFLSVDIKEFYKNFAQYPEKIFKSILDRLVLDKLVENTEDKYVLTKTRGLFWGNNVCKKVFEGKFKNIYNK